MKIRILKKITAGIVEVLVKTEDWSQNDKDLMIKFGEPEINLGGTFSCDDGSSSSSGKTITLDDVYARIMTESPFTQGFDSRDYVTIGQAREIANRWASAIETRVANAILELRSKDSFFTTEEVTEY